MDDGFPDFATFALIGITALIFAFFALIGFGYRFFKSPKDSKWREIYGLLFGFFIFFWLWMIFQFIF